MNQFNISEMSAVILDMDGVLWKSLTPLCDLEKLFDFFRKNNVSVTLATNNGLSTVDQYVQKLAGFGVKVEPWQIVTSAMATGYLVKRNFPEGGPIFIMGEQALHSTMEEFGFSHNTKFPQAVIAGLTKKLTYDMIKDTSLVIQTGIPFYFTNPDPTYPSPEGIIPGAGTVLAALETASGVKAIIAGKPMPFLFELALDRMDAKSDQTLVIGDRLSTDILGGQNAGCKTAMVLTGVSTKEDFDNWGPKPDFLLENIADILPS